jgi:hypothetical protein
MNKGKSTRYLLFFALIFISILLAFLAFIGLSKLGIVNKDPKANLSDWVSALIASLAFLSGAVAVWLAYKSFRSTQKTEEGSLYIEMMKRYASAEMKGALLLLSSFYKNNKDTLPAKLWEWNESRLRNEQDALKMEEARHTVKYFYPDLMQIVQAGYFSKDLAKEYAIQEDGMFFRI